MSIKTTLYYMSIKVDQILKIKRYDILLDSS